MIKHILIVLVIVVSIISPLHAQYSETEIKAAFVERFTRFIDWPSELINNSNYFTIGVIDGNVLEKDFVALYTDQKIKNKPVKIININSKESFNNISLCNIVYITDKWAKELKEIKKYTTGKPILLVGDNERIFSYEVMINFYSDNKFIRFNINQDLLSEAGLQVDFRLLEYASFNNK